VTTADTLAAVALVCLAACGGTTTVVGGQGSIGSAPPVAAAMQDAAGIAGHSIALQLDAVITASRSREEIDHIVAGAAEVVARDLSRLRRNDPAAFASEVPRLATVACRYGDGGEHEVRWEGTALVITRRYQWKVLAEGDVAGALRDDFYASLARRFAAVQPEQVAPADRADYFVYLTHDTSADDDDSRRKPAEASVVARVLRLGSGLGTTDPKLAEGTRAWLVARASDMARADPSADTTDARQTRAAWTRWLVAALPSASVGEKLAVARAVFADRSSYGYAPRKTSGDAIDGLDTFAFGLSIADAWIAASHPAEHIDDPAHALWQLVLDPPTLEAFGRLPRFNYGSSPWLRAAFETDPQGRRLADALAARKDPALLGAVIYSMPRGEVQAADPRASLLQQLERYPDTWRQAMLVYIGQGMASDGCGPVLVDEANRVWRQTPALRGTALHVIACKEGSARGISDTYFVQFEHLYGQTVDAPLFGAFLDDGPDAMRLADALWPAMSKGWSRAAVIAPRLGAFMADPRVRAGADEEPMRTLRAIGRRLCGDGPAEVALFHQTLVARARSGDATQARALAAVVDETEPGRCVPNK